MKRLVLLLSAAIPAIAAEPRIWQPVIDYTMSFPGDRPDAAPIINPFENFTHLASDFGWMGPGEARIDAKDGIIRIKPGEGWAGAWHSLSGLAREPQRRLDLTDLIGLGAEPDKRCVARAISINASGHGVIRLELAAESNKVVWSADVRFDDEEFASRVVEFDPSQIGPVKFLQWVCPPESQVKISSVGFLADRPRMPLDQWAFHISLGKLRRCHDPASGSTRDRGHLPAGKFDTIAATGMHALASAAAAADGLLDREMVMKEIDGTLSMIEALPKAAGVLPHFLYREDQGGLTIVPGTEFSTVDSAIALHGLLLATRVLESDELRERAVALIEAIDFKPLVDPEGWISHGYFEDGKTLLGPVWRDWGGETALVLAMEAMAPNRQPVGKMSQTGEPYRGVGFIAEIQSLFYPDFDRAEPDLVSGIQWPEARRKLLRRQVSYLGQQWPESPAAQAGLFGVSAGEAGMPGAGYSANGIEVMAVRWLYPHYMLMGAGLNDPGIYAKALKDLDACQLLYPFGLPENIEVDMRLHNPMNGGLNASFESLAAYHGWKGRNTPGNKIDAACMADPLTRKAAARFYRLDPK